LERITSKIKKNNYPGEIFKLAEKMEYYFILVEPSVPGNIGAAARAIKIMGFRHLWLVKPGNYLDQEAIKMAHGSGDILKNARIFDSLKQALNDIDFIVGTSARKRTAHEEYVNCSELPQIITNKGRTIKTAGFVFGREESGLTNDELKECDIVTHIPMVSDYPSVNLAQAVMIYTYILSGLILEKKVKKKDFRNEEGFKELKRRIKIILADVGIDKNPTLHDRIMERLILLNEDDIHLLYSFTNKYQEKYRD
jgi:tRNA/rRNA methyltransferase